MVYIRGASVFVHTVSVTASLDPSISKSTLALVIFSFLGLRLVFEFPTSLLIELENISFV